MIANFSTCCFSKIITVNEKPICSVCMEPATPLHCTHRDWDDHGSPCTCDLIIEEKHYPTGDFICLGGHITRLKKLIASN